MAFKDENYITIQGWMITRLKLKGNDLILFALIYGFSQDDETEFRGSQKYMCEVLNRTRPTVAKSLENLASLGLIIKRVETMSGVTFNRYKVNLQGVKKLYMGDKETLHGTGKETLHYNTSSNNTNDKPICQPSKTKDLFPLKETKITLFRNSNFGGEKGSAKFLENFNKPDYAGVDIIYYYHAVKDWSDSANKKRTAKGWLATARTFMRGDKEKGKLKMQISDSPVADVQKKAVVQYLKGYDE